MLKQAYFTHRQYEADTTDGRQRWLKSSPLIFLSDVNWNSQKGRKTHSRVFLKWRRAWLSSQWKQEQGCTCFSTSCISYYDKFVVKKDYGITERWHLSPRQKGSEVQHYPGVMGRWSSFQNWGCDAVPEQLGCPTVCQSEELGAWQEIKTPCCWSIIGEDCGPDWLFRPPHRHTHWWTKTYTVPMVRRAVRLFDSP